MAFKRINAGDDMGQLWLQDIGALNTWPHLLIQHVDESKKSPFLAFKGSIHRNYKYMRKFVFSSLKMKTAA